MWGGMHPPSAAYASPITFHTAGGRIKRPRILMRSPNVFKEISGERGHGRRDFSPLRIVVIVEPHPGLPLGHVHAPVVAGLIVADYEPVVRPRAVVTCPRRPVVSPR